MQLSINNARALGLTEEETAHQVAAQGEAMFRANRDFLSLEANESAEATWAVLIANLLPRYAYAPMSSVVIPPTVEGCRRAAEKAQERAITLRTFLDEFLAKDGRAFQICPDYEVVLEKIDPGSAVVRDTATQAYRFFVRFNLVTEREETSRVVPWDASRLVARLRPEHLVSYESCIQKFVDRHWWRRVADKPGRMPGVLATVFPATPTEEKTTKVRPVTDERPANARSPPVSNSQLSTLQAATLLRGALRPGYTVYQADLDNAFYRCGTQISDEDGVRQPLLLWSHQGVYSSDRLVFGLACGPLVLACVLQILTTIAKEVLATRGVTTGELTIIAVMVRKSWSRRWSKSSQSSGDLQGLSPAPRRGGAGVRRRPRAG